MLRRLFASALLICATLPASAQDVPQSAIDAIRTVEREGYDAGYDLAGEDAVTRDLVTWLRLREGSAPFVLYQAFLEARSDWPDQDRIRARAEQEMPKDLDPDTVIAFFAEHAPETGEGAVRLAEAHFKQGRTDAAEAVIVAAWRDLRLTNGGQAAILDSFSDIVADHHVARVHNLLWRWRTAEAERMLDLLDDGQRALVRARVGYIRKLGDLQARMDAVPEALKSHPGLLYDRYNWLADNGRNDEAVEMLRAASTSAEALGEPFRWSGWRRSLARRAMRDGDPDLAYELASRHFLKPSDGESYSDLEWLSGYLQLTYLDDAEAALEHFIAGADAVDSPISVSRMAYWEGRALEALGRDGTAAYERAAPHQTAFYGLLAADRLGQTLDPALAAPAPDWDPALMEDDVVRAALTLLQAGERGYAVPFFAQLGRNLTEDQLGALGAALTDDDEIYFAVLLGKSAVTAGKVVPSIYFPLHPVAEMDLRVEPALALSIARRESEFNAGVGSPVGALGLMQLMPATAQEVAGFEGIGYSKPRLTSDWAYNARLGDRYLAELQARFGRSPVQIAAGYNAGPSRPASWMDERGDPRVGEADVIDWIEHIPFRETRNYVQRVTESIPVYRARLTGEAGPIEFLDLLNGQKVLVRPVARGNAPDLGGSQIAETVSTSTNTTPPRLRAVARPAPPAQPSTPVGPRPVARPEG